MKIDHNEISRIYRKLQEEYKMEQERCVLKKDISGATSYSDMRMGAIDLMNLIFDYIEQEQDGQRKA